MNWRENAGTGKRGMRGVREGGGLTCGADSLFYGFYHPLVARGLQAHFGEIEGTGSRGKSRH